MTDIVKYNNDFNLLPMPDLHAREMDLFMLVLSKLQFESRELKFNAFEFFRNLKNSDESYEKLFKVFDSFADKILGFKISHKTPKQAYAFVCFEKVKMDFTKNEVKIIAQKDFYDMILNHNLGYTRFELLEFASLSGKYTKILYRLLKQFRRTGKLLLKWDDFVRILQIPPTYTMCDIDKQILKPAIKELTKERNLFDSARTPFKNLKYTKTKGKGRGRGGNVIGIEFSFEPEKLKNANLTNQKSFDFEKLRAFKWYHQNLGEFWLTSGDLSDKKHLILGYQRESGEIGEFVFESWQELELKFDEFEILEN